MVSSWVGASYRLGALAVLGCLTACGPSANAHDDPAAWDVAPHQELSPHSTGFTAVVTRTDCSSGEQGTPVAPVIDAGASTITITFRIAPHISGGTCEGTAGVAFRVHLDEPIGTRMLVDGACRPPGTHGLETTSFCLRHGVRLRWQHGKPRFLSAP